MRKLWPGAVGLLVALGAFLAAERQYDGLLSLHDLWTVRLAVLNGILLLGTVILLWWYSASAHGQNTAAQEELGLARKTYIENNKPVVYCDRYEHPGAAGSYTYVLRNVGGGFALNVYFLDHPAGRIPIALGSLAASAERAFPHMLQNELCQARSGAGHVLLAEGQFTRTTQWTPTLNFRTPEGGSDARGGHVEHATGIPHVPPPRFQYQGLAEYLSSNGRSLREQLENLITKDHVKELIEAGRRKREGDESQEVKAQR